MAFDGRGGLGNVGDVESSTIDATGRRPDAVPPWRLAFIGTATTLSRLGAFTVLTDPNLAEARRRALPGTIRAVHRGETVDLGVTTASDERGLGGRDRPVRPSV
jgi:hypothetical protein